MSEQNITDIEQKFVPSVTPTDNNKALSHLFVFEKEDGGVGALAYTPSRDSEGKVIPLTQESFYDRLTQHDTDMYNNMADSIGVPRNILAGAINYKQDRSAYLAPIKPDIEERFKDLAKSNPIVAKEAGSEEPTRDNAPSYAPAVQSLHVASILDSFGFTDYNNLTDKQLRDIAFKLIKDNEDRVPTDEEVKNFVHEVRNYKPTTRYKKSATLPLSEFKSTSVNNYNAALRISDRQGSYDNWWEDRGVVKDFWNPNETTDYSAIQKAVEFFRDPVEHFNTELHEEEEKKFQQWFSDMKENGYILQGDVGYDYDFRGAFKDGYKPVKQADGTYHWTDKYKKPNHETFSKESKHATGIWKKYAGEWKDGTFEKPVVDYPRIEQQEYTDYQRELMLTTPTEREQTYNPLVSAYKRARRALLYSGGSLTGYAASIEDVEDLVAESTYNPTQEGYVSTSSRIRISKPRAPIAWLQRTFMGPRFRGLQGYVSYDDTQKAAFDVKADIIKDGVTISPDDKSPQAERNRIINKSYLGTFNTKVNSDRYDFDILPGQFSSENTQLRFKDIAGAILKANLDDQMSYTVGVFSDEYPSLAEEYDKLIITAQQAAVTTNDPMQRAAMVAPQYQSLLRKTTSIMHQRSIAGINGRIFSSENVNTLSSVLANPATETVSFIDPSALAIVKTRVGANPELAYIGGKQLLMDPKYTFGKQGDVTKGIGTRERTHISDKEYLRALAFSHYDVLPSQQSVITAVVNGQGIAPAEAANKLQSDKVWAATYRYLDDTLGETIGLPGEQFAAGNYEIKATLSYLFTFLALSSHPGKVMSDQDRVNIAKSIVDEYAKQFLTSKKYHCSITKGAAADAGIFDTKQLDYYLATARRSVLTGIERDMIGSQNITDRESLKQTAPQTLQLYVAGGMVYAYVQDTQGMTHVLQTMMPGEPIVGDDGKIKDYKYVYGTPFALELPRVVESNKRSIKEFTQQAYRTYPELGNVLDGIPTYSDKAAVPGVYNPKAIYQGALPLTADNIVRLTEYQFHSSSDRVKNIGKMAELYNAMRVNMKQQLYSKEDLKQNVTDDMVDMFIAEQVSEAMDSFEGLGATRVPISEVLSTDGTTYRINYRGVRSQIRRSFVRKLWEDVVIPKANRQAADEVETIKKQKILVMPDTKKAKEQQRATEINEFNSLYDALKGGQ